MVVLFQQPRIFDVDCSLKYTCVIFRPLDASPSDFNTPLNPFGVHVAIKRDICPCYSKLLPLQFDNEVIFMLVDFYTYLVMGDFNPLSKELPLSLLKE